ncbi:DUF21 domain-containing protein [Camellia lanceoleosa]|uniref:DUF21 domain-containing protein n=1 Tax=Camellia lanceoleosa TaxID=1840588 RepID=A0ACC0FQ35_9ERIC|nr:DUF21 domain-containing protein [Camellia lanceoleosa]
MLLLICNVAAMEALPIFLYSLITAWGAILISVTLILLFGETGKGGELTHDETTILGRNNRGLFGGASGLMGLGRSDLSLVSQTSGLFGGVFSYCLPSTDDQASANYTEIIHNKQRERVTERETSMAFKTFLSRITSSFKIHRSKNPSNIPIQPSPQPLFIEPVTPLPFKKPHRSFKHRLSSFLGCGFRTHEGDLPESPPCKWDETPRRDYNSSISSDSDDELFCPPPPPTRHPITTFISGDSEGELFPPPPPPPTPTRYSITTALADTGLCGYESDDEEEEIVTLSLNRKTKMKKLLPPFPAERSKMEGGRSLLERCDERLHSRAEMTNGTELQPSTVSVLDSSFYKDESSSPSPVMKRSIEFKDELGEFDEDIWSPAISPIQSKCEDKSDDCDFVYISEILRASNYLPEDYDIFQWLEKQQYLKGNDTSEVSSLRRKLIYDTVSEILDRDREMSNSSIGKPSLHQIWSEFQRIRERDTVEDLPRKELLGDAISRWRDCPVEMSEVTLDIERMIFKDLVGETIGDLVAFAGNRKSSACWFTDAKRIGKPF